MRLTYQSFGTGNPHCAGPVLLIRSDSLGSKWLERTNIARASPGPRLHRWLSKTLDPRGKKDSISCILPPGKAACSVGAIARLLTHIPSAVSPLTTRPKKGGALAAVALGVLVPHILADVVQHVGITTEPRQWLSRQQPGCLFPQMTVSEITDHGTQDMLLQVLCDAVRLLVSTHLRQVYIDIHGDDSLDRYLDKRIPSTGVDISCNGTEYVAASLR